MQPGTKQTPGACTQQQCIQVRTEPGKPLRSIGIAQHIDLVFGKIQRRFNQHTHLGQLRYQAMDLPRKFPRQRSQSRARGGIGGRVDQIGNSFGLNQIKFVVEKRPLRKFTRLGQSRAQLETAPQQHPQYHRAPMCLQLKNVLARERLRCREVQHDTAINRAPVGR